MGEADFGAVDCAIADGFDEDEGGFVFGVEDDSLDGVLWWVSFLCALLEWIVWRPDLPGVP